VGEFGVEPEELRRAVAEADAAADVLDEVCDTIRHLGALMLDERLLHEAVGLQPLGEFGERWRKEFELIKEMVVAMNDTLAKTADAYVQIDRQYATQLHGRPS
jgi:hypothetical protein